MTRSPTQLYAQKTGDTSYWYITLNISSDAKDILRSWPGWAQAEAWQCSSFPAQTEVWQLWLSHPYWREVVSRMCVFLDPGVARVTKSFFFSCVKAALSCHMHRRKPKHSLTACILSRDGRPVVESSEAIELRQNRWVRLCMYSCLNTFMQT